MATESHEIPASKRHSPFVGRRWLLLLIAFAILVIGAFVLLSRYFPYSKKNVTESLLETFPGELKFDRFQVTYFPRPACIIDGVTFRLHSSRASVPPLVTIQKMTVRGSYLTLLIHSHHVSRIILAGLRVQVPLPEDAGTFFGVQSSKTTIGEVVVNGALLEVTRSGNEPPLRFDFHEFSLGGVSAKHGMSYRLSMHNPEPPGEVQSTGHIGPFAAEKLGQTPVAGTYSLDRADLRVSGGIATTAIGACPEINARYSKHDNEALSLSRRSEYN